MTILGAGLGGIFVLRYGIYKPLLVGAILAPGQRTVAAALRVMGRSDQRDYARYHGVLNRAVWSSRAVARVLLVLLLQHLDRSDGPLIFGA